MSMANSLRIYYGFMMLVLAYKLETRVLVFVLFYFVVKVMCCVKCTDKVGFIYSWKVY